MTERRDMAETGTYANAAFDMSPTSQADESPCGRPERATASKPSGAVKSYSRWVAVCLGLLCVLLLALNIGLGVRYVLEKRQLQSEREDLLANHVNITMERDQALASNTNLTRQMDQLLASYVNISMERDQVSSSTTNLTRQMDQLLSTNEQLRARISELEKRCPSGWRHVNTTCYLISSSDKSWPESRQHCKDIGGDLVIISSEEEQVFIHGLGIFRAWIGLMYKQGVWEWVDSSPLSTSYWDHNEPNPFSEQCALIDGKAGNPLFKWHDYLCRDKYSFICEMSAFL
ncbi:CD209 antigen-like [Sardina pilchardus]|uniref:CD209 antigen-like n=1 Tax=Sardina pilchardus TaxID=27697 RepID=UPI002E0D4A5C